jgi:hypothetical protein
MLKTIRMMWNHSSRVKWCNLSDRILVAWNGEEALNYFFGKCPYEKKPAGRPKVTLLHPRVPKVDGLEAPPENQRGGYNPFDTGYRLHLLP